MRRAILVASSQFENPEFHALQFPVRDAERFRDILRDPQFCGFDEVTLLANDDTAKVKQSLELCARRSEPGDLILFYYNGHGKLDRDGSLALVMPGSNSDILRATSLLADEVKSLFNFSRASQRIMILDCCYSGAADSHGFKGSVTNSITSLAQQFTGSFLLTASRRFERAWELAEQQAGALTEALIEGVTTGAAAPPGSDSITLTQLAAYVRHSVPASSPQQPEYWDNGGIGEVVFSKKAGRFDTAWAARARRMITQYVSKQVLDEELAEELREVIGSPDRERHADRLRLIDGLAARELQVSAFVRAWSKTKDETPTPSPPPPPPPSPSPPPPSPSPPPPSDDAPPAGTGAEPGSAPTILGDEPSEPPTPVNSWRRVLLIVAALTVLLVLKIAYDANRPVYNNTAAIDPGYEDNLSAAAANADMATSMDMNMALENAADPVRAIDYGNMESNAAGM